MSDFLGNKDRGLIPSQRPGSGFLLGEQLEKFPFEAFEWGDINGSTVTLTLKSPWSLQINDDLTVSGTKSFRIKHPSKKNKTLIHACLEGPENGVYYRGEAELTGRICRIELPEYFEDLVKVEGRTAQITCIGGYEDLFVNGIENGVLTVMSRTSCFYQKFYWEVKGVRIDLPALEVEIDGNE